MGQITKSNFKGKSIMSGLNKNEVLVFVGAHPDDETLLSPFLAYAADNCREVVVLCITKGESGWNLYKEDLTRTLARVRQAEFEKSLKILNCKPIMLSYTNGVSRAHPKGLAVLDLKDAAVQRWKALDKNNGKVANIYARWTAERGDPADAILKVLREIGASIIITMDPVIGCTRHPEHVAVSEATRRAMMEYRKNTREVPALYYLWRKPEAAPGARIDPAHEIPGDCELLTKNDLPCEGGKDYLEIADAAFECYESQFGAMSSKHKGMKPGRYFDDAEWYFQTVKEK